MKKHLKGVLCMGIAAGILFSNTTAAFAGTWRRGAEPNQDKWWYDFDNGSYAANGWQWIDGDNDGVSECYYFDAEGWMLADTVTPDGYTVNADGAWTENGVVQINVAGVEQEQIQTIQTEETSSLAVFTALSGSYHAIDVAGDFWPHDPSWIKQSIVLSVAESNGIPTATLNGSAVDVYAIDSGDITMTGYISSLGSIAVIFGDGRMFIYSDDGSEVSYQKD